jgi:hypothetical protein
MPVQRFLASAWASVHASSEPRRLLVQCLENGFAGLAASPGPRAIDWSALATAAADLPFEFGVVRDANPHAEPGAAGGLGAAKDGERQIAVRGVHQAVGLARLLQCPKVVVDLGVVPMLGEVAAEDLGDPAVRWGKEQVDALLARRKTGRNAALDRVCRELFSLAKSFSDIDFCVTANRSLRALADVATLQDLFEDLAHVRLFYWHDAALVARRAQVGLEPQGEWLETFSSRCRGMSCGDASDAGLYLPPGAGGVDYGLLASYVPRTGRALPVVVELDAATPPAELPGIRSCLDKYGL